MRLDFLILVIYFTSCKSVSMYDKKDDFEREVVLSCVNRIVKRHLSTEHQLTILTQGSKDYVKGIESTVRLIVNLSKPDKTSWVNLRTTKEAVVFLEADGAFKLDLEVLKFMGSFHPVARFLVVYTNVGDTEDSLSTKSFLTKLVQYLNEAKRLAVAIALSSINGNVNLYGYTKTQYGSCDKPEILNFGKCKSDKSVADVFQDIINYNHCPLRLATFDWPPYSKFLVRNERKISSGIESDVVNIIVERLNASTLFHDVPPSVISKMVSNDEVDIGWGQLGIYQRITGSMNTYAYYFVEGKVLVPKITSTGNTALNILTPLESTVWIVLISIVIFVLILRHFARVFKSIPLHVTLAMFLGLGAPKFPTRLPQRIFLISLLICGWIMSQAYLANLTMIFTKVIDQDQIKSLEELDKSNLPLGSSVAARSCFEETAPRLYREFKTMNLDEFKKNLDKLHQGSGGIATYVEMSRYHDYKLWPHVIVLSERMNFYPVVMLVPNVSSILPKSDWIISSLFNTGIIGHRASLYMLGERPDSLDESVDPHVGMNLQQFTSIFKLFSIALGLSTVVFFIEIISPHLWKK